MHGATDYEASNFVEAYPIFRIFQVYEREALWESHLFIFLCGLFFTRSIDDSWWIFDASHIKINSLPYQTIDVFTQKLLSLTCRGHTRPKIP